MSQTVSSVTGILSATTLPILVQKQVFLDPDISYAYCAYPVDVSRPITNCNKIIRVIRVPNPNREAMDYYHDFYSIRHLSLQPLRQVTSGLSQVLLLQL
jgi:hypothetical protein